MRNVLNTLRVLEEVATRQPVGVGELARVLDMPKSSVQRALHTLNSAGWIRPATGEITRWAVTTKALDVGRHASGDLGLRDAAMPVMEDLRRRTEETIHLTVPEGGKVVLIERLETSKPVRISMALGHALPLHASANGKAVLANSPAEAITRLLAEGLPRYTDRRSLIQIGCSPSLKGYGAGDTPPTTESGAPTSARLRRPSWAAPASRSRASVSTYRSAA
jgi:IclR family acetate operon transcriptional repressor